MGTKRIYIGGLYHEATKDDLEKLFSRFGSVEDVEIKKKIENDEVNFVFGYVSISPSSEAALEKCFQKLNGTFWKGRRLKLEMAKESFLSRLQREREQDAAGAAGRRAAGPGSQQQSQRQPPPPRRTAQQRIMDQVLAGNRRSSGGPAGRVVDFLSVETPGPDTSGPAGEGTAKKRRREQTEEEQQDQPAGRGQLRMFAGIGTVSSEDESSSPHRSAGNGPVKASGNGPVTSAAGNGPVAPAADNEPATERLTGDGSVAGDFLSRLEAYSAVWGDDEADTPPPRPRAVPKLVSPALNTVSSTNDRVSPVPGNVSSERAEIGSQLTDPARRRRHQEVPGSVSPEPSSGRRQQRGRDAADDNLKRLESLRQRQQVFKNQKRTLQMALSSTDAPRPNKKIVFDEADMDLPAAAEDKSPAVTQTQSAGSRRAGGKPTLFGDSSADEEDEDFANDFRIRPQYEGQQGQKLQELQSRFGGDARFRLDARFASPATGEGAGDGDVDGERDTSDDGETVRHEHAAQLDILQSVLGKPVSAPSSSSSSKGVQNSAAAVGVRFDPTLAEHRGYALDTGPDPQPPAAPVPSDPPAPVTRHPPPAADSTPATYYQVSVPLSQLFSRQQETAGTGSSSGFSLLKMLGKQADSDDDDAGTEQYRVSELGSRSRRPVDTLGGDKNPFQYDSSDSGTEGEESNQTAAAVTTTNGGGWGGQNRTFFLSPTDPRLTEGAEFVRAVRNVEERQKNSEERRSDLLDLFRTLRYNRTRQLKQRRRARSGAVDRYRTVRS